MSKDLQCPHCGHDVSLDDSRVEIDGSILQRGGCCSIEWSEDCPHCGEEYTMNVDIGPVGVSVHA